MALYFLSSCSSWSVVKGVLAFLSALCFLKMGPGRTGDCWWWWRFLSSTSWEGLAGYSDTRDAAGEKKVGGDTLWDLKVSGEQEEDLDISDSVSDSLKVSLFIVLKVAPHSGDRMKSIPNASLFSEISISVMK